MDNSNKPTEPKVEIFAEKPGTAPVTQTIETALPVSEEKTAAEADAKLEEQKQEAKIETLEKNDNSGEAG